MSSSSTYCVQVHCARNRVVEASVEAFFSRLLFWLRVPRATELHVHFRSLVPMALIHQQMKNRSYPTDVLTVAGSGSGCCGAQIENSLLFADDFSGNTVTSAALNRRDLLDCGDIYVCPQYILAKCQRFPFKNLSCDAYVVAAYIHACLHAVGYDHGKHDDYRAMAAMERWLCCRVRSDLRRQQLPKGLVLF